LLCEFDFIFISYVKKMITEETLMYDDSCV
jgi:hypothetical protein